MQRPIDGRVALQQQVPPDKRANQCADFSHGGNLADRRHGQEIFIARFVLTLGEICAAIVNPLRSLFFTAHVGCHRV